MSSLKDLLNQIETLQNQVSEVRQKEVGDAISKEPLQNPDNDTGLKDVKQR